MKNKRVLIPRLGGSEVLQIREENIPEPKFGEVRVRVLAAGVSYADMLMREGVHPETPRTPFTPGWDVVGVVDKLGEGVSRLAPGQMVAALPIRGGYAEFICLKEEDLVPIPSELDPAEAVSLVLNYVTAYQLMHRATKTKHGERGLIHSAAGGVGTALVQLGKLLDLDMYGTASQSNHERVLSMGCTPIDYKRVDFVEEILNLTGDGVDVVFDGIGGPHLWRSVKSLRRSGHVLAFGSTAHLRNGRMASGQRHRLRGLATMGYYIVATSLLPGKKRMIPYSIQWFRRLKPAWFKEDLTTLMDWLGQGLIKPIIAERIPLVEAPRAHDLLARGSVMGRIVLFNGH